MQSGLYRSPFKIFAVSLALIRPRPAALASNVPFSFPALGFGSHSMAFELKNVAKDLVEDFFQFANNLKVLHLAKMVVPRFRFVRLEQKLSNIPKTLQGRQLLHQQRTLLVEL